MIDPNRPDSIRPDNVRPPADPLLVEIAAYAHSVQGAPAGADLFSAEAYQTARLCLMDALGCAMAALAYPACTRLLGPLVPGVLVPDGARVPGTAYQLDPVTAAFNLGAMIRWLDYNDTWLAAEWGHPSDNLGGILMLADWLSRQEAARQETARQETARQKTARQETACQETARQETARQETADGRKDLSVGDILTAMIQAYEIQGVLALENSLNRVGLDHVLFVEVATTAVAARLLGCTQDQTMNAVSNAWIDGGSLRTYRHAPNTGSRKSWAAGDASSRGVRLAFMAAKGEMGYPSALSAPTWGFQDALFRGQPLRLARPFGSYVMENILFKVSFPAEFHAQTAVEAAFQLHPLVKERLDEIERVVITTQESAMRIINKTGPLYNPADRDHCIQYMTAVGLISGGLTAADYEDQAAADPHIDALREKMACVENPRYSVDYLDPNKRSIANAVQVFFRDGTQTAQAEVEYPLGHRRRRAEAVPLLREKFAENLSSRFSEDQASKILALFDDPQRLEATPVRDLVDLFIS